MTRSKERPPATTAPSPAGRMPPHDLDAEAVVLSSATWADGHALDDVADIVEAEHFYSDANRAIYEAVAELHRAGRPHDVTEVAGVLRAAGNLERVGGMRYLALLAGDVPAVANPRVPAGRVRDLWRLRRSIAEHQRLAAEGYSAGGDVVGHLAESERVAFELATQDARAVGPQPLAEGLREAIEAMATMQPTGIRTGLSGLDEATGGLHPGQSVVIAARPGMGKSALALDIALSVAEHASRAAVVFSLEMGRRELVLRAMAQRAEIDAKVLMHHPERLTELDWHRAATAADALARLPLHVDDEPSVTLTAIRSRSRRLASSGARAGVPLGLVVVDYLQLMKGEDGENREQEIGAISRGLKRLAKELQIPVVSLSQLNREVEKRSNKRPTLADLRESGAIEQDADLVLMLFRPGYYLEQEGKHDDTAGRTELCVAKNRHGPTRTIGLTFYPTTASFRDAAASGAA